MAWAYAGLVNGIGKHRSERQSAASPARRSRAATAPWNARCVRKRSTLRGGPPPDRVNVVYSESREAFDAFAADPEFDSPPHHLARHQEWRSSAAESIQG